MIHSFLLIGQSNMAGRGFANEVEPISDARLKVLRNGRWQGMYVPVNPDRPFSGVNLAESFALKYAQSHNVEVGLIPCADGGTSLAQWAVGSLLYDHAVLQARLAQRTSTIAGVLWHQGESDCAPELYPHYQEKLTKILTALRADLDLYDVPILLGGLGDYLVNYKNENMQKNYMKVNAALCAMAEGDKLMGYVPAEGLLPNPDGLHFSAAALREFGERYFDVFCTLEDKNKVFAEKPNPDDALRTELELL